MGLGLGALAVWALLIRPALTNYPQFDINTQMRSLLLPADARIGSVIYRLRATDSDKDYPLIFAATDYGSYVIRVENVPCDKSSSYCEANVFLERTLVPDQVFKFRITVRDTKGDTTTIPVSIKVTNGVTDFNEVFPHVPGVVMIPEDTKVGTELEYVIVKKHPRSVRQAELELWGSPEFKFHQTSKQGTTTGIITLAKPLDYERKTMYTLSVYATGMWVDLVTDSRNIAGFQLVVVVTDVQDTPPVFDHIEPITKLSPNLTMGDKVLRVTAKDGDKGSPRPIRYGLLPDGNPFTVFFSIDQDTGDIRLVRPLKELTAISRSHQPILLTVMAEEVTTGKKEKAELLSSTATVALLLGRLGNTPPYFESPNYVARISENSGQGTALVFGDPYITEVRDDDMGKHGVFSLYLENSNGTFEITPNVAERHASFIIRVRDNKMLDYETHTELRFKITAKEVNPEEKPLSSRADVTVYIMDENDNPPVFLQPNYTARISENATKGTLLVKVQATDVDTGDGGIIRYSSVIGPTNSSLNLDFISGQISIATDHHGFDREESSSYVFLIEARDMKGAGNRATVPLTVIVLDVNDNAPVFDKSTVEFILGPDGYNFSQRAFIKATDRDAEPPNNVIRYEIINGNYGNRFILNAESGEMLVNARSKVSNQQKETITDLLVRAYDLGVPSMWATAQVRIFPAESAARVMRFLVPGSKPDQKTVQQLLQDLTGARVVIHSIEPYYGQAFNTPRATDLTGGSPIGEKSIVTATVIYGNNAVVDLDNLQKKFAQNRTEHTINESVTVYRTETRALFWILLILLLLLLLIIISLLMCCFCKFCPGYYFFSRFLRRKSAVQTATNTFNFMDNPRVNKSVQAEWLRSGHREAWSAEPSRSMRHWHFNRRNSDRRLLLVPQRAQPNIVFTREIGAVNSKPHNPTELIMEDVDGTEYRVLDPSRLPVVRAHDIERVSLRRHVSRGDDGRQQHGAEGRPPTRDEKFIRDGNAEILRLVTRGRDHQDNEQEPKINQPERPYTHEEGDGKGEIMKRFIEDANSPENKAIHELENQNVLQRVMGPNEKSLSTADVNKLTTIQRDILLTRFLVEENRRNRQQNMSDDTQSLPGVVAMATQTDSHAGTQTDRMYFRIRRSKSDNDESGSETEENAKRRFKKAARVRIIEEKAVEAFRNRSTPIMEESDINNDANPASKPSQGFTETKASLLRHAATRVKLGIDDDTITDQVKEVVPPKVTQAMYRMTSTSDQDINSVVRPKEGIIRSLQVTPVKQMNITNNVLVEHVTHQDSFVNSNPHLLNPNGRKSRISSVPSKQTVRPYTKRLSSSEPRKLKVDSSPQQSSSIEKEGTAPRYMEWYKKKREMREKEKKHQKEPSPSKKPQRAPKLKNIPKTKQHRSHPVIEMDEENLEVIQLHDKPETILIHPIDDSLQKDIEKELKQNGIVNFTEQYRVGPTLSNMKNHQALEKKSIFTIAYDDMETKPVRLDTASTLE